MAPNGAATVVLQRDASIVSLYGSPTLGVPDAVMAAHSDGAGQRFGAAAAISGVDPRSTTPTANQLRGQMAPAVTMAADGSATAAWYLANDPAGYSETLETASAAPGGAFSAPVGVAPGTPEYDSPLTGDAAGDAVMLWEDATTGYLDAAGRIGSGGGFGAPTTLDNPSTTVVTWQELAYQGDGREGSRSNAEVSLEFAPGTTLTSIGRGRLIEKWAFASTSSGTMPAATAVGGGNGPVYEIYALNGGKVYASRLIRAR